MRDGYKSNKPRFIYRPWQGDDRSFRVSVTVEKGDDYGTGLCTVQKIKGEDWRIDATHPSEYGDFVKYMTFDSKEQAAMFCYLLISRCEEVAKNKPCKCLSSPKQASTT